MGRKAKIAVAVVAVLLLTVGAIFYFHRSTKPARTHPRQSVAEFVGVGIQLRMDAGTRGVVIAGVVPGTPAAAAGITTGFTVSKVDDVSLEGKSLVECINLIRGSVGTTVKLELVAPDNSRSNIVELTRRKLKL